jgi:ubiquinone/menaquinone biosynthesis C-methylase UbiE
MYLRCPNCAKSGQLRLIPNSLNIRQASCRSCGNILPVYRGIPEFAKHIPLVYSDVRLPQKIMNSRLFAVLYESPVWRPLHTLIGSGVSIKQEVKKIIDLAGSRAPYVIADLACGTGHYARELSRQYPEAFVYGLDISLNMLLQGLRLLRQKGYTHTLLFRGDIHLLPFDDESLDWANCGGALHLFSDLKPIWKEVSRVLKPGGVFTGMAIAKSGGMLGKVQKIIMNREKTTFFYPEHLSIELSTFKLSSFRYKLHGIVLLFSAVKESDEAAPFHSKDHI